MSPLPCCAGPLAASGAAEAVGAQLGISHRVHDVAVAQVVLQRAGVDAIVGELEAAGVSQHVRMSRERKFGQFSGPADHFEEPGPSHRPTAFGIEDISALQVLPPELAQCPNFLTARAREEQADKLTKEILELSDKIEDDNPVKVQRARLQVDSRKWLAARLAPKKYSDHITHDVKGGGINFQPQILIQCSSDEGEGFIDVRAAPEAASGPAQQSNGDIVPRALTGEPTKANWRKLR